MVGLDFLMKSLWAYEKLMKQVESKLNVWMEAFKQAKGAFIIQTSYWDFMKERLKKQRVKCSTVSAINQACKSSFYRCAIFPVRVLLPYKLYVEPLRLKFGNSP